MIIVLNECTLMWLINRNIARIYIHLIDHDMLSHSQNNTFKYCCGVHEIIKYSFRRNSKSFKQIKGAVQKKY